MLWDAFDPSCKIRHERRDALPLPITEYFGRG